MPSAFNFNASPFDSLTPPEQRLVRDSVDVAYFREGDVVLEPGRAATHLLVIIKGYVQQQEGDEVITTFGPDDCFDGRSLVSGTVSSRFIAAEEVVAYELKRDAVMSLIAGNATFSALLFSDLGQKLSALSERQSQHQMQSLTLARVDEAFIRPVHLVDAGTSILEVVRVFHDQRTGNVLVQDRSQQPSRTGIFTTTALQRAILDGRPLSQLAVGELSNYDLVTVKSSDQIGDAMALMLGKRVHRVVVMRDAEVVGVLEALDLFSFLSNHSHMITVMIEQATSLDGLAQAAMQITRLIGVLQRGGTRVGLIAQLVQQLNARLFERAWQMMAPRELQEASCLFVMGSEGRGEQLLKTDQDNGLILRDGYTPPSDLAEICGRFSDALERFGYPPCPGGIMVNNPEWRGSAVEFSQRVRQWLTQGGETDLMNLAIFMDAHTVAGDDGLLQQVRQATARMATDNDALLARFASAIDAFGSGTGFWNRLLGMGEYERQINLKKLALFPLVHGVRALALSRHIGATSTVDRIDALVKDGTLNAEKGGELVQALHLLMSLKLKAGLQELDTGKAVTGDVALDKLGSLERDLFKDALGAVKRFKQMLHQRFRLDAL